MSLLLHALHTVYFLMPIVDYHIKISKPVFIRSKTFQSPVNRNNYRSWYETDAVTVWSHFAFLYNPNFAKYGHYVFSTVKNMNKVFIQSRDSVSRHFHVLKPERNETASEIDKMKIRNKRNRLVVQTLWFACGLKSRILLVRQHISFSCFLCLLFSILFYTFSKKNIQWWRIC